MVPEPGIPLWMYFCPIALIILFLILIAIIIHLFRRLDRKRWWTQQTGYGKWLYENYSVKEACEIIDRLMGEGQYKEAQRFIHELMKVHPIAPGTYSWYYYKLNHARAMFHRYEGRPGKLKEIAGAADVLEELQYDPFVLSDDTAFANVREDLQMMKDTLKKMKKRGR
ncbi:MAG: hypothetical protein ACMUHU_07615 [Thermoplasmatota archaeon]